MAGSSKQQQTLKALNYDLFENNGALLSNSASAKKEDSESLLPAETLYHLFDRFNFVYFDGHLPRSKIEYSNRMTCAGSYTPATNLIKLSRKYHMIFPDEIEDTLKHEMIHIIHFNHNAAFKAEARRIGASLKAKTHPSLRRLPKYLYLCPGCGLEYPRQKIVRMSSCGKCSKNNRYNPLFKLKLLESLKSGTKITYY